MKGPCPISFLFGALLSSTCPNQELHLPSAASGEVTNQEGKEGRKEVVEGDEVVFGTAECVLLQ